MIAARILSALGSYCVAMACGIIVFGGLFLLVQGQ